MSVKPPIDGLEWKILELLRVDGRLSNREVARRLGVSEGAVRAHVKRMEDQKVMRIAAVTNVAAMGLAAAAQVGVYTEKGRGREVAKVLAAIPGVSFVAVAFGQYDIVAVVLVETREHLLHLLSDTIATIPGVRRTETAEILRPVKHDYTQVKLR